MAAGHKLHRWRTVGQKIPRYLEHLPTCDTRRFSNDGLACTCGLDPLEEEILLLIQDKQAAALTRAVR